jgi:hypothetical protein
MAEYEAGPFDLSRVAIRFVALQLDLLPIAAFLCDFNLILAS